MRRRLALALAAVATLAVVLFAVPLALVLERTYRDEELGRLERDTVAATREIDLGTPLASDPIELPATADVVGVYEAGGRRVAGGGPAVADDVVRRAVGEQAPTDRPGRGRLVVAVPLVADERVTGAVRAERSAAAATRSARRQWWLMAGVAAAAIAVSALAAVVLGRRLARPLERLAHAARRLGEGDFSMRSARTGVRELDDVGGALDGAAGRLDELVTRERAFSADASHQLRTPLAALRIELEALDLRSNDSPELSAALAQVDRLQSTIDTLLAVARDSPRGAALTGLGGVLDDAESRWRGPLASRGRPLRLRMEEPQVAVRLSESVLREIIDVLLDNAMRHGSGVVEMRVRRVDGSIALDVADEGTGAVPDEVFARGSGSPGGRGIGLALARSLAQVEGAQLRLSRAVPPVFTLLMPP